MPRMRPIEERLTADNGGCPEDTALIKAIEDCRRAYKVPLERSLVPLFLAFAKPEPEVRRWLFDLAGWGMPPPGRAIAELSVVAADAIANKRPELPSDVPLTPEQQKLAAKAEKTWRNPAHTHIGRGRPAQADLALILRVVRTIEKAVDRPFTFSRKDRSWRRKRPADMGRPGGPMLRLAETALQRLLRFHKNPTLRWAFKAEGTEPLGKHYGAEAICRVVRITRRPAWRGRHPQPLRPAEVLGMRHILRASLADAT